MCLSFIYKAKQEGPEDELFKVQVKLCFNNSQVIYKIEKKYNFAHNMGLVWDLKSILSLLLCELDGHTVVRY